jgi:hypothetical protein
MAMTTLTTTTTTTRRRPRTPLVAAVALAVVLTAVLAASGARLTWNVPSASVEAKRTTPVASAATVERAARLAAVRAEATALRRVAREVPAIRVGLRDRIELLAAIGAGHVPVEALDRPDDAALRRAVRSGQVPPQTLERRQ